MLSMTHICTPWIIPVSNKLRIDCWLLSILFDYFISFKRNLATNDNYPCPQKDAEIFYLYWNSSRALVTKKKMERAFVQNSTFYNAIWYNRVYPIRFSVIKTKCCALLGLHTVFMFLSWINSMSDLLHYSVKLFYRSRSGFVSNMLLFY